MTTPLVTLSRFCEGSGRSCDFVLQPVQKVMLGVTPPYTLMSPCAAFAKGLAVAVTPSFNVLLPDHEETLEL